MVCAPQPLAVEEGVKVLRRGGNAIDAALVVAMVQGVIDPQMCGIGGTGSLHLYSADRGESRLIDFHGRVGSRAAPEMWQELVVAEARSGEGYLIKGHLNDVGYQSVTIPGTVAGLYQALERYGSVSWKEVLQPAIELAAEGFTVTPDLARWFASMSRDGVRVDTLARLCATEESCRIYTHDGEPYQAGEVLAQPDLARTLGRLADEGPEVFYHGELAQVIARDFETNGGLITSDDLESYVARVNLPLEASYRGFTVRSSPAPGGGISVLQQLRILDAYDLSAMGHNSPEYIDLVARTMQAAYTDRANLIGDPAFVDVPVDDLLGEERAGYWRERIDNRAHTSVPRWRVVDTPTTTHVSVVDGGGSCAALTHTLGASSGVITPGLGFTYNNCMNCINPVPGHPDSIAPGKSRLIGLSPTIVYRDEQPVLVLGAPGGTRIMGAVLQTIFNWVDFGMSPLEAVSAPRFDCQGDVIDLEARIPRDVAEGLRRLGHEAARSLHSYDEFFALVHAIEIDRGRGRLRGGADPRRGGVALEAQSKVQSPKSKVENEEGHGRDNQIRGRGRVEEGPRVSQVHIRSHR